MISASYWVWVPLVVAMYAASGAVSKLLADRPGAGLFWLLFVIGVVNAGLWPWVAASSRRLLFDALLFDFLLLLAFHASLLLLGCGAGFKAWQWTGLVLVFVGFVLLKIE